MQTSQLQAARTCGRGKSTKPSPNTIVFARRSTHDGSCTFPLQRAMQPWRQRPCTETAWTRGPESRSSPHVESAMGRTRVER